ALNIPSVPTARTAIARTTFSDICGPGKGCSCTGTVAPCTCTVMAVIPIDSVSTLDFRPCGLLVKLGQALDAGFGMLIKAASLHLESNANLLSHGKSGQDRGSITMEVTGPITLDASSRVDVSGDTDSPAAGFLAMYAGGDVTLAGDVLANGA